MATPLQTMTAATTTCLTRPHPCSVLTDPVLGWSHAGKPLPLWAPGAIAMPCLEAVFHRPPSPPPDPLSSI